MTSGENKTDGVARAQLSQLFFAQLTGAESARSIARGVCYCCKTAMATDTARTIYAAWRQVYPGNVRDIAFSKSSDGGRTFSTPVRVSDDNWVLDGCPENGPAIALDAARRIHIVWPTLMPGTTSATSPTLGLFYAMSKDGRRFTERQKIPTQGVPRHVQVTVTPASQILVAWDEQSPGTRRIAIARGNDRSERRCAIHDSTDCGRCGRKLSHRRQRRRQRDRRLDERRDGQDGHPDEETDRLTACATLAYPRIFPTDSPTRTLARRIAGSLRSRGSLAIARSRCRSLLTESR